MRQQLVLRVARWAALAALGAAVLILVIDRVAPPPLERGRIVSPLVTDRTGEPLRAFPIAEGRWRLAADTDEIDPAFLRALIAIEDKRFYRHAGVDPLAVMRAARDAAVSGQIKSGASTITMQTARMLYPRPRTLGAKAIEAFRALQIEARLSKKEILDLYLTLTPYGGNIEGVRAASWAWFGRDPKELTPDQIALLIALPQSPEVRRPDRRPQSAQIARAEILDRLVAAGLLAKDRADDAATEPLPRTRHPFPSLAWHAAEAIKADHPSGGRIQSTLDRALQQEAERLVTTFIAPTDEGVQAAALIIDHHGRAVRAAVGSASRARAGGWIDLTNRKRSPGSTLKPLIYAMAFDDGAADGGTLIRDLPARFASYRPENFDRTFRGEVTVAEALQHSLNVPAVRLLDRVGANRFMATLSFTGGTPMLPSTTQVDAGLAVALGGVGLSVREVGVLYAGLGQGGRAKPLAWTLADAALMRATDGYPFVSTESAAEVMDILAASPAPPGRMPAELTLWAPTIAYKTGTSYGYRDAWAAGISGGYTIIVWTGRPDGAPRPGVTGREGALPLLVALFDAVKANDPEFDGSATPARAPVQSAPLAHFYETGAPPAILFPPEGAEIWSDRPGRSFVLSAQGDGPLKWYANGQPVDLDAGGSPIWAPHGPGFYRLAVVDAQGQESGAHVRVRMPQP